MIRLRFPVDVKAPAESLWPLLADTDRINRAIGLPAVSYEASPLGRLYLSAKARLFGLLPIEWDEPPYEWVEGEFYSIFRRYRSGLIQSLDFRVSLEPRPAGTRVEVAGDIEPRWPALSWLVKLVASQSLAKFASACGDFEQAAWDPNPAAPVSSFHPTVDTEFLRQRLEGLREKHPPKFLARLEGHLREASDSAVSHMRPYELADFWGVDRLSALRAFLAAAHAGVLRLRWEVLCPNCRVSKADQGALKDLRDQVHCETCGIRFDSELDRNVELRFSVDPRVRAAADAVFCIGAPARSLHRPFQVLVAPGQERVVRLNLPGRGFWVRELGSDKRLELRPSAGLDEEGGAPLVEWPHAEAAAEPLLFQAGALELRLRNRSSNPLYLVLERQDWLEQSLSAACAATIQEFQDYFPDQVPAEGLSFGIRTLGVLVAGPRDADATLTDAEKKALAEAAMDGGGLLAESDGRTTVMVFASAQGAAEAACLILERAPALALSAHWGPAALLNQKGAVVYAGEAVRTARSLHSGNDDGGMLVSQALMEHAGASLWRRSCVAAEEGTEPAAWRVRLPSGLPLAS